MTDIEAWSGDASKVAPRAPGQRKLSSLEQRAGRGGERG
jgi:hypothetical protein